MSKDHPHIPRRNRALRLTLGWAALVGGLLSLSIAALTGCATLTPHFSAPHLSIVGVSILDIHRDEQRFKVRMHVQNPNTLALPIKSINYTLQLEGDDFGTGAATDAFVVPASGETDFDMTVTTHLAFSLLTLLPRLKDHSQSISYRATGTIKTGLAFMTVVPFDERGQFSLGKHGL
jgi:LEA14-like dessication related protein